MNVVLLCLSLSAWADFEKPKVGEPLDPAIWSIVEEPEKQIYDAVIVEDVTEFATLAVNRYRKVRILSENGKRAAEFVDGTGKAQKLKGRVIDRSGKVTPFNSKQDFVEVLDAKTSEGSSANRILLPPGLTSDCVVEFSWEILTAEGLPGGSYRRTYNVQTAWFVKKKVFLMNNAAFRPRGNSYFISRWGRYPVPEPAGFEEKVGRSNTLITYTDVPAYKRHPFGRRFFDPMAGGVIVYKTFPDFGRKPEQFWPRFGREYLKDYILNVQFGKSKDYKNWIKQLKASLPEDHIQATVAVYNAFRERVSPTDLMDPVKKQVYAERGAISRDDTDYLADVWKYGYGDPSMLCELFYHVAKDCELPVYVVLTNRNTSRGFHENSMDPFTNNIWVPFFGVKAGQNWVLLAPAWAEYDPGLIPSEYQGGRAIAFDTRNKWNYEIFTVPRADYRHHQLVRQYTINLDNEGKMLFSAVRKSAGEYNASTLRGLLPYPQPEREARVQENWQDRLTSWEIGQVSVKNADKSSGKVEYLVSGTRDLELEDEAWVSLNPFPGDWMPLAAPEHWPKDRKQPIILPRALTLIDLATINVPDGWKLRGNPTWEKSNAVGKVSFKAMQQDNKLTIRRDILVGRDVFGPEQELDLKHYIAWMEEAMYQTIGLERGGAQ